MANSNDLINEDFVEEEGDIVDKIYKINDEYLQELDKDKPNKDKLVKLLNKQLWQGMLLQRYR